MKKTVLTPVLVILLMAAMLSGASKGFATLEADYAAQEMTIMMRNLLPYSSEFVPEEYTGEDESIRSVYKAENGYVIETVTAGYAGDIRLLVGVSNKGKVTGLVVRDMSETHGLGANAWNDVDFLAQFLNTSGDAEVGTNVDALTGATVSSKAITRGINSAVAFVTGADIASGATEWGG